MGVSELGRQPEETMSEMTKKKMATDESDSTSHRKELFIWIGRIKGDRVKLGRG